MIYNDRMNADTFIRFMKRLIKDADRKIFLILDNLRVHHSYKARDWLEEHTDQIEVFFLPSYSPELNPDEYLNCDLKAGVHSGPPARSKEQLKRKTLSHLRKLQKLPKRNYEILQNTLKFYMLLEQVFNRRVNKSPIKTPGIFWKRDTAEVMLFLRSTQLCGRWNIMLNNLLALKRGQLE